MQFDFDSDFLNVLCVCGVICVYALNVRGVLCDPPLISVVAHRDLHIDKLF